MYKVITRPKNEEGLGVGLARKANPIILEKLVWNIQKQPNKLWVNMIKAKYVKHSNFFNFPQTNGYLIWNFISKARIPLHDGFSFVSVMVHHPSGFLLGLIMILYVTKWIMSTLLTLVFIYLMFTTRMFGTLSSQLL